MERVKLGPIYFHLLPTLCFHRFLSFSWPDPQLDDLFTLYVIFCYELVNAN